jgi:hypothetical protein
MIRQEWCAAAAAAVQGVLCCCWLRLGHSNAAAWCQQCRTVLVVLMLRLVLL